MTIFSGPRGLFACYCLVTESLESPKRCYIGFTNNPLRRIRQHNRKIAGGARKTSRYGPWRMVLFVGGFSTKISALKFEYIWTYPTRSRYVNCISATSQKLRLACPRSISTALDVLVTLLIHPPFSLQPLYVVLLDDEGTKIKSQLEQHSIPVFTSTIETLQVEPGVRASSDIIYAQSTSSSKITEPTLTDICPICQDGVSPSNVQCMQCTARFCITCAGKLFTRRSTLIPISGKCPICKREFEWKNMLRKRVEELIAERKSVPYKAQDANGQLSPSQNSSYDDYDTINLLSSSSEQEKDDISRDESGIVASTQAISSIALSDSNRSPVTTSPTNPLAIDPLLSSPRPYIFPSDIISITD
ncbi:GIY-YIG domain containing protein [Giardia lamblia P15]|uniref:Structure-specific endonuclease subunit SLX1 homolog n=1 Tax=Giardia intestinalis (strain P15) TaxID=658858 RepID=E1F054_GIAIA|nr:GIY-YIG domain containing protein [Giardia lamblia P15]